MFTAEQLMEARLLATFPSDRAAWDENTIFRIANFRSASVFFCPCLQPIQAKRQAQTIERIAKKHLPKELCVRRRYLSTLAGGDATTLDKVVAVAMMLTAMETSPVPSVRHALRISRDGSEALLEMPENCVIPSHLWVDRYALKKFREHYAMKPAVLGTLIFGPDADFGRSIVARLENGDKHRIRGNTDEERLCDYRVTPYTAEQIYFALEAIFERLRHRKTDPFPALPEESNLFIASHTAGAGAGRLTRPLPIRNGNLMQPMRQSTRTAILRRVDEYATSIGFPPSTRESQPGSSASGRT